MCKLFWINSPSSIIRLSDRHKNLPTNNTQRSSGGRGFSGGGGGLAFITDGEKRLIRRRSLLHLFLNLNTQTYDGNRPQ